MHSIQQKLNLKAFQIDVKEMDLKNILRILHQEKHTQLGRVCVCVCACMHALTYTYKNVCVYATAYAFKH